MDTREGVKRAFNSCFPGKKTWSFEDGISLFKALQPEWSDSEVRELFSFFREGGQDPDVRFDFNELVDFVWLRRSQGQGVPLQITESGLPSESSCQLRIIHVNDVYELDLLANLATCRRTHATRNTICVLAGDFLAPSLLSSLDKGFGMVDTLNRAGMDYVCFGNHECDIPHAEMLNRIAESKFVWINTNMQKLPLNKEIGKLPEYVSIDVRGEGGHSRRAALLGLNTEDPKLYTSHAWAGLGSECIDPILPTAKLFQRRLLDSKKAGETFDLVIPLTHQTIQEDRTMANSMDRLPIMIGGHDHDPYDEQVNGTRILKMGCEAQRIGITDLVWPTSSTLGSEPIVEHVAYNAKDFPPDIDVKNAIVEHQKVLRALDTAFLCEIPTGVILSSEGNRYQQTTMGSFFASALRDALHVDCAFLNAGPLRGNRTYSAEKTTITYNDFKNEIPYDAEIASVRLPGKVINDIIIYSRQFSILEPAPKKFPGCFLQIDNHMTWDEVSRSITHIKNQPIRSDDFYECALFFYALTGLDDIKPLIEYCKQHPQEVPSSLEAARPAKELLVDYFAKEMLWHILNTCCPTFSELDSNSDGNIYKEDLRRAVEKRFGSDVSHLMVDNVFATVDLNKTNAITPYEFLMACAVSHQGFNTLAEDAHGEDAHRGVTRADLDGFAKKILGSAYSSSVVYEVFSKLDADGSSFISHDNKKNHLARASQIPGLSI